MGKATLTFDLPEETHEFEQAVDANRYSMFVWEFEQELRKHWKYMDLEGVTANDMIQELWDLWHTMKADAGIRDE